MSKARKLADLLDSAGDVSGGKIADDTINSEHFVDGGIDDAHIGDLAATKLTGTIASGRLSAANLGSGTVPTARLGSGTANNAVFLRGDNTWAAAGSTSASDLTSGTLPSARLGTITNFTSTGIDDNADALAITIDSSENVGIGNASPLAKLDVSGNNGSGGYVGVIRNDTNLSGYHGLLVSTMYDTSNSTVLHLKTNSADPTTGGTDLMVVRGDGKVGIGSTSPAGRLHVEDTASGGFTGLMISNRGTGASAYDAISWRLSDSSGTHWTAAATEVHKEGTWTSTASTRDSRMQFRIIKDDAWVDALSLRSDGRMLGKVILNSESGSGRWANSGVWKTIQDLSSHPGGTMYMCEAAIQSLGGYTASMLVYKSNNTQYQVVNIVNTGGGNMQMSGSNVQYRQNSGADQTNTSGFQRVQVVASVGSHS
jgi:hypothetical protein